MRNKRTDTQTDEGHSRFSQLCERINKTLGPRITANLNSARKWPNTRVCDLHVQRHQHALFRWSASVRDAEETLTAATERRNTRTRPPATHSNHSPAEDGWLLHQDMEIVFAAHLAVSVVHRTFKAAGSFPGHLQHSIWGRLRLRLLAVACWCVVLMSYNTPNTQTSYTFQVRHPCCVV